MMRRYRVVLLLIGLMIGSVTAAEPIRVVTSIKPIHSLVAGIMQGVGEPLLLMNGSVPPWEHMPDLAQQHALAEADLVVWTGAELEPLLGELLKAADSGVSVIEVLASDEMKVLVARGDETRRDAWFWLDSRNMLILLDVLTRELIQLDPSNSHVYERNRAQMFERISMVDREMEYGYRGVAATPVFFYHDSHQYFEQAYAMKVVGSVASPPEAPAAAATGIIVLKEWLENAPVLCLFTEQGIDEPHLGLLLAGSGVNPIELDSIGSTLSPGPDLYITLMEKNFRAIADCVAPGKSGKGSSIKVFDKSPAGNRVSEKVIPNYLMQNQYGETVTNNDFPGQFQLINFGYTFCPDICPTTLGVVSHVMNQLGADAEQVQPIFITVDPERDTLDVLKKYTAYFHPRLMGLSASPEMTRRTADNFKARYQKVPSLSGDPGRYGMDHTASLYLLGKRGEFITKFPYGMPAEQIVERIRESIRP